MEKKQWQVNEKSYTEIRLLGKGKGGYSYLVTDGTQEYVLKQIHHEPCTYYQFANKLEAGIWYNAVVRGDLEGYKEERGC